MRKINTLLLLLFAFQALAQPSVDVAKHGRIQVVPGSHYLQHEDGRPFFWLGDTAWELFHRLSYREIELFLENRRQKGFTVIQAVILAEFDGLRKPNRNGDIPLHDLDPTKPNERYFLLVDSVVALAAKKGLIMGLLPTWGDKVSKVWGEGPEVFNEKNAAAYGKWLGSRYAKAANVAWIVGGDRNAVIEGKDYRPVWRAMAQGILEGTSGKALITYHPQGGQNSTSVYLHEEPWLHMNMMQSGHGGGHDVPVWNWIERDRNLQPAKPTLDSEPNYEDHPVNPWPKWDPALGYFRDWDVRKQTYRSVFAGACGVTYGHHSVWQFWSPREEKINHADRYWTEAIDRPGAFQVGYLRRLIESRPMLKRIPDPSLLAEGQGEKSEYAVAIRSENGSFAMIYLPTGKTIKVNFANLKGERFVAWWFNPRTGKAKKIGCLKAPKTWSVTTPTLGAEQDWVLVLDDKAAGFAKPGKQ